MLNKLRISMAAVILVTVAALVALTGCGKKSSSSSAVKSVPTNAAATEEVTEENETTSAKVTTAATTKKQKTTTTAVTTKKAKTTTAVTTKKSGKTKTTTAKTTTQKAVTTTEPTTADNNNGSYVEYKFRNSKYLNQHFEKHGSEFDGDFNYRTAAQYEKGASDVINNPDALFKYEAEDGDEVYYLEETNEFVILSTDGYIRTYFRPNGGKSYFDRQ